MIIEANDVESLGDVGNTGAGVGLSGRAVVRTHSNPQLTSAIYFFTNSPSPTTSTCAGKQMQTIVCYNLQTSLNFKSSFFQLKFTILESS